MTAFISGAVVGIIIGWVVFKRPQWADSAIAWIKAKLRIGT